MSRVSKSIKNAKVGVFFFVLSIIVQFFSRKIFLEYLGDDFIGLTSTLRSILGFLNLAELGIGTAIGFALYKPIYDEDKEEINKIIALLGVLYKKIGYIVIGIGIFTSLFFFLIFDDTPFSFLLIYFSFYSFLVANILSYFFNYHQSLLGADQKGYIIKGYFQTFTIIKILLQVGVAIYFQNLYLWIALELIFDISYSIIIRIKIKQEYPWLNLNSTQKTEILKQYPDIIKKIKQVFVHKMSAFVKNGTDNILVFLLVNLQSVAFFGNYQLIFLKLNGLLKMAFAGTGSAIGNLVAEKNQKNIHKIFWELITIQFFIAGTFSLIIFYVMDSFILFWLGKEYILATNITLLMIANFFVFEISSPVERFKNAYGLYSDVWAAITEALLNLGISFLLGNFWGIEGILIGTLASVILMVVIWKPYFLYKNGFKQSVLNYWKGITPILIILILASFSINYIVNFFNYNSETSSLLNWIIYTTKITFTVILVYGILLFLFIPSFRVFYTRIKNLILGKFLKQ